MGKQEIPEIDIRTNGEAIKGCVYNPRVSLLSSHHNAHNLLESSGSILEAETETNAWCKAHVLFAQSSQFRILPEA